jgi:hypothetical protein
MGGYDHIDITSATFAKRFAALLCGHRVRNKQFLWRLSRHSDGRYSVEDLQAIESGTWPLDEESVTAITDLYGATFDELLPPRVSLLVSPLGTISANEVEVPFDPDDDLSLLAAYLQMVRTLRDQLDRTVIELRREDVEVLSDHLQLPGSHVVSDLATLMGANERERRAMATMFIAGASVISVSTPPKRVPSPVTVLKPGTRRDPGRNHPSRYHLVIPERDPAGASITVLADWHQPPADDH